MVWNRLFVILGTFCLQSIISGQGTLLRDLSQDKAVHFEVFLGGTYFVPKPFSVTNTIPLRTCSVKKSLSLAFSRYKVNITFYWERCQLYLERPWSELLCPKKGLEANQVVPRKASEWTTSSWEKPGSEVLCNKKSLWAKQLWPKKGLRAKQLWPKKGLRAKQLCLRDNTW